MLKWTVSTKKSSVDNSLASRRTLSTNSRTTKKRFASETGNTPKRRRKKTPQRRSLATQLELRTETSVPYEKENRYSNSLHLFSPERTHQNALRDVSNLTSAKNRYVSSPFGYDGISKYNSQSAHSKRRKYSSKFEFSCSCTCNEWLKGRDELAPTLPSLAAEDSPCVYKTCSCFKVKSIGGKNRNLKASEEPNVPTETENLKSVLVVSERSSQNEVSPLVQKFFNLNFSRAKLAEQNNSYNNSSLINNLSLDKIIDAVLESSTESNNLKDTVESTTQKDLPTSSLKSHGCNSFDSGFSGTFDKQLHEFDNNFKCKCQSEGNKQKRLLNGESSRKTYNNTIIELNDTYNERSVDVINSRRKRLSDDKTEISAKRLHMENSSDSCSFTLKRQKCIRRRKVYSGTASKGGRKLRKYSDHERNPYIDDNFNSEDTQIIDKSLKGFCDLKKKSTPNFEKRSRRYLNFYSPNANESFGRLGNSSTPKTQKMDDGRCKGTVHLEAYCLQNKLFVKVKQFEYLMVSEENQQVSPQVKIVVETLGERIQRQENISFIQRNAVQTETYNVVFNRTFQIPLVDEDFRNSVRVEFWQKDLQRRRTKLLGWTCFSINDAVECRINGSFALQSSTSFIHADDNHVIRELSYSPTVACESSELTPKKMNGSQSTNEEIVSLGDNEELTKSSNKELLNEQQKEADDNVFLRYLELDPMEGPEAIPAATQRKATGNKSGRTPFTSTKILTKIPKTGFGFSVVWTHPPRVERIERGSPAEKVGMMPGDYIIFVDKHNVVMMPEVDILNLIKSCGNQLTLEIFRRHPSRNGPSVPPPNRFSSSTSKLLTSSLAHHRPSTVGSSHTTNATSIDCNRKRLHLPQVMFSSEKAVTDPDEARRKTMFQIISKEQAYVTELQFGTNRFLSPLAERRDIISPLEHRLLFQNLEEILKISEDILDSIIQEDGEQSIQNVPYSYYRKLGEFTTAYRKYCSGIKKADCVLADRTKNPNTGFVRFLQTPLIPRKRPDITAFIHKPLEHFRDLLNLFSTVLSHSTPKNEDYNHLVKIVRDMQVTYKEITKEAGFMEPGGEGRLLLSIQDLENRLVFTKCKPFVLSKPGRHWIFGGDLCRVEGRNIRQYWTLLFTDIILFAKVSRDRVLFITEEPLPLSHITEIFFNVRKKSTEFRLMVQPGGVSAKSPTVHCGLDITKTPRKNAGKRCIVLRAPNIESKAIWQNLLQRQIFRVNSGMEGSTFSSPLESPEAPLNFSAATLQSTESLSNRRQNAQNTSTSDQYSSQKQIHEIIEHKCKQMGKSGERSKGNALHLEQWMKNQLTSVSSTSPEEEPVCEIWSEEQLRKRTQELLLEGGHVTDRNESRCEKMELSDASPSKSTSFESQVTVRSSPVGQGSVKVCKQCQKTCLNNSNNNIINNNYLSNHPPLNGCPDNRRTDVKSQIYDKDFDRENANIDEFAAKQADKLETTDELDPFSPLPRISVNPPTPDMRKKKNQDTLQLDDKSSQDNNQSTSEERSDNEDGNESDDDESQENSPSHEEQPYHVLSKSNPSLRRFGTLSSLEKLASEDINDNENFTDSDESDDGGIDNESFNHSRIRSWTSRAGAYVSEKIAFFEKLGEDYRSGAFFERYLKSEEVHDDDCENSAATSGEEVWGTPTSGDMEDPFVHSNCDGQRSLSLDSGSSENDDDAELMMDELLMTPPVASVNIRGLLPRTTLEPLMEEDSDTCTSSSSTTEQSPSSKQGNGTGAAADTCSTAAKDPEKTAEEEVVSATTPTSLPFPKDSAPRMTIHRSESYRNIIDAEDDGVGFFRRLPAPTVIRVESAQKCRSIRLLEILNVRKGERKIYETFPTGTQVIKIFSKENSTNQDVPTSYGRQPLSPKKPKDKPLDRRFWRQLSRRRGSKSAVDSAT